MTSPESQNIASADIQTDVRCYKRSNSRDGNPYQDEAFRTKSMIEIRRSRFALGDNYMGLSPSTLLSIY